MKHLFILLFFATGVAHGQPLRDKIQGSWVCLQVTDSVGNATDGELGASNNFLKFRIKGTKLFISQAPFDIGVAFWVRLGEKDVELIDVPEMSQIKYTVVLINEDRMVLRTMFGKKTVHYHFANQKKYATGLDQLSSFRDFGVVEIDFVYLKMDGLAYTNVQYQIGNSLLNLVPAPEFKANEYLAFGQYFSSTCRLPSSFDTRANSKTLVAEFDVTKDGLENISIVEGIDYDLDVQVFEALRKSGKRWSPLVYEGKVINTRVRLGFLFTYSEM